MFSAARHAQHRRNRHHGPRGRTSDEFRNTTIAQPGKWLSYPPPSRREMQGSQGTDARRISPQAPHQENSRGRRLWTTRGKPVLLGEKPRRHAAPGVGSFHTNMKNSPRKNKTWIWRHGRLMANAFLSQTTVVHHEAQGHVRGERPNPNWLSVSTREASVV